jgi:hypothetical protein
LPPKGSVRENPGIVQDVAKHHLIGVHTQHHPDFNGWFADWSVEEIEGEISGCYNEISRALDGDPCAANLRKIFRPPYFSLNTNVCTAANNLHFQIIMGAGDDRGDAVDVMKFDVEAVKEAARALIEKWQRNEPCVLVFHDISTTTANNIAEIIRYLRRHEVEVLNETVEEGFTLVHFDPEKLGRIPKEAIRRAINTIYQSETVMHSVPIDSTVGTVTFNISWQGSDLDLVLRRPDGTRVDPARALVDSSVKYGERDTYEYYTVSRPTAGAWTMVVSAVNVPLEGERYTIRVEGDTDLALFAFAGKPDFRLNEHIDIKAELANGENPVAGASVMARVKHPDGSIDDLALYDDGMHADENPNDGFYANSYSDTSLRGSYEIALSATGMLSGGRYERASSLTAVVGSIIYDEVDFGAYTVFADHWMAQNCAEPGWCDTADIDQSGSVDIFDLCLFVERWLDSTP